MHLFSLRPLFSTAALFSAPALFAAAPALQLLPGYTGGFFNYAQDLSTSGTVVGFGSDYESTSPLLWTRSGGGYSSPATLALLSGGVGGAATAIAPDASWISGYVVRPLAGQSGINQAPVLWTRAGSGEYTPTALPRLGATPAEGLVAGGSANGSRLIGNDGATDTAVVWRGTPGGSYAVQALPLPPSAVVGPSYATAISAGGERIVGRHASASGSQAVVWTETAGTYSPLTLQTLGGGAESFAETISANGALAAGASDSAAGLRPVTWDTATGRVTALAAPTGASATVLAISDNALWFGGRATDNITLADSAVLWDAQGAIRPLFSVAAQAGLAFGDLAPASVTGIYLSGSNLYTIIGFGVVGETGDTRGFALENIALDQMYPAVPEPASCAALAAAAGLLVATLRRTRRFPSLGKEP